MEPKSSGQFEQGGVPAEYQVSMPMPERKVEHESRDERVPFGNEQAPPPPALPTPVAMPLPTPVQPVQQAASSQSSDDDTPVVAADEDLIEKEWVDKAKKIIAQTKDDPYKREREVNQLQADYLQKRYGKNIGKDE